MKNKREKSKIFHHDFLKKDRKGILMPETLKIVLAVIGITILAYFTISLIDIFLQDTDSEQAHESLLLITNEISHIESGNKLESEFFLKSPDGWRIVVWGDERPTKCDGGSCLCLCPCIINPNQDFFYECLKKCKEENVCQGIQSKVRILNSGDKKFPILIDGITSLKLFSEDKTIIIKEIEK